MKNYLTILLAVLFLGTMAQNEEEKTIYDSLTYQYTQEGIWDSVIDIAKESIYKGNDSYIIRMRLANAYEEEGNYRLAERQYHIALSFNPEDTQAAMKNFQMANEGRRNHLATKLYGSFNEPQQRTINSSLLLDENEESLPIKYLDYINAAFSYSFTNSKKEDLFIQANTILYSEGAVREHQSLAQIQFGGQLSKYINWDIAYNYKQIDGYLLFEARNRPSNKGDFQISQNELFGQVGFYSGDGWNLNLNAMYALQNKDFTRYKIDSIGYFIPSDSEDSILIDDLHIGSENKSLSGEDFVIGLSLNKKISIVDFSVFASYARVGSNNPFQLGGEITILPNGNYHLYLTNQLYWYKDQSEDRAIYKVIVGGDLYKDLGFMASATFGNIQNTKDPNSAMFYNLSEHTKYIGNLALCYHFNDQFSLSLRYQILQKSEDYFIEANNGLEANTDYPGYYNAIYKTYRSNYKFTEHQVFLGLCWQF